MTLLNFVLWWGELPLQAVLLWVLVRKQSFRIFPWFFAYTAFAVAAGISRFLVQNHHSIYLRVYWTTETAYALLGIAVMYEVFRNVFRNFDRLWWFPPIFPLIVLLSLGLTIWRNLSVPEGLQGGVVAWIIGAEVGVRLLQVAMFALLVTMVLLFGGSKPLVFVQVTGCTPRYLYSPPQDFTNSEQNSNSCGDWCRLSRTVLQS
jgi:hypothetical protein